MGYRRIYLLSGSYNTGPTEICALQILMYQFHINQQVKWAPWINMTFQYVFFFSSTDSPPAKKGEKDKSMNTISEPTWTHVHQEDQATNDGCRTVLLG